MVISNVNLTLLSTARLVDYKDRVLAVGVACLVVYAINFLFQFFVTFVKKQGKPLALRKLMEVSQVLYWFGIGTMFSIFPPFYYGGFNAVVSYVTLLLVILMHVFCLVERKVCDRSLFSIFYFFYHLAIMVWLIVGLILAYIWSNSAYQST